MRAPERVRAMIVVRLNQLAAGGSGGSPALLDGLAAMLEHDALPRVHEHGSVGTGDLTALATTALALAGEAPTSNPLPSTQPLGPHDALAFMSSNAAVIGDAALIHDRLSTLAHASAVVAALTFTAVDGNREAFSDVVEQVTPFAGARRVCHWMRAMTDPDARGARIQDPFGLRTLPQTLGPLLDALDDLAVIVQRLANAPSENPVVLPGPGDSGKVAHHGGFHAAYLATGLSTVLTAAVQAAKLIMGRLAMLNDPAQTGLPAFLGDGSPGASGVMMLEYVAASAMGELRAASTPPGHQTVVLSRGVEEDASFASQAARQATTIVDDLAILLACELVAAVRAVRLRQISPPSALLAKALVECEALPDASNDRDLSPDLTLAAEMLPALAATLPSAGASNP
jgi:histidine ammonia-lyase